MISDRIRRGIIAILNRDPVSNRDPVDLRLEERIIRVVSFSILNARILHPNIETTHDAIQYMIDAGLLEDDPTLHYNTYAEALSGLLEESVDVNGIVDAYVSLLNSEIRVGENGVFYDVEKDTRGLCGAYYTPPDLARNVAEYAVDTYLSEHMGSCVPSIFDPACGCGELLVAAFESMLRHGFDSDEICSHMFAADLDPIALQITAVRIFAGRQLPSSIFFSEHFMLGNSLISESNGLRTSHTALFAEERIYSAESGILDRISSRSYDIVIGNPPWRKVRFEDRAFFRQYSSSIADITKKSERESAIEGIRGTSLYEKYGVLNEDVESFRRGIESDVRFQHSCVGEINTYATFTELALNIMSICGVSALIVKASLMSSPVYSKMFTWMMSNGVIRHLFFFDNSHRIFDIDSREKFCVAIFSGSNVDGFHVSFGLTDSNGIKCTDSIMIRSSDLEAINPLTHMIPGVSSNLQFHDLIRLHRNNSSFSEVFPDCHFGRLVHLTMHSRFISNQSTESNIPILEGKMIGPYTSNYSSFSGVSEQLKYGHKARSGPFLSMDTRVEQCRYFIDRDAWENLTKHYVEEYSVFWRSLTSSTNARTMIATLDHHMPSNQSVQLLQCPDSDDMLLILSLFNSSVFDYILRMKLPGIDLTQKIVKQMPVPPRSKFDECICYHEVSASFREHLISRVLHLLDGNGPGSEYNTVHCSGSDEDIRQDIDYLIGFTYGLSEEEILGIGINLNR